MNIDPLLKEGRLYSLVRHKVQEYKQEKAHTKNCYATEKVGILINGRETAYFFPSLKKKWWMTRIWALNDSILAI